MTALTLQQAYELALQHHHAGRLAEAEGIYRQILAQQPEEPQVLHMLALLAYQVGQHAVAIELASRAIASNPTVAAYHNNLGLAQLAHEQTDFAVASLREAIRLEPTFAEAHNNLGNAYRAANREGDAIGSYRAAIAANPRFAPALVNLGNALRKAGDHAAAITQYRAAIEIDPRLAEAHASLGTGLLDLGQPENAVAALKTSVRMNPRLAAAHFNLGVALKVLTRTDEAIASYRAAIQLHPRHIDALTNLGSALFEQGVIALAIDSFRQAIAIDPDARVAHSNLCYTMHFDPHFDGAAILREHCNWGLRFAEPLKTQWISHPNNRNPNRRIRIGYLSPDFHQHPIARFLLPLLENHDHKQFEIFGYHDFAHSDAYTGRIRATMDAWRDTRSMNDERVGRLIQNDQIDILIDLSAHMRGNRLGVFALKPAPVQASYLAYCSTTGVDAINWRISDPYIDPPGADESMYVEKTIRLPRSYWCYQSPAEAPDVSPLPARNCGHVTFCCLNNFAKVSAAALAAFCQILKAVPDSRLILHVYPGSQRQRPIDVLKAHGIDPTRLTFMPLVPLDQFLATHQKIDIALDSFPYNGGTTSCDAMWMGVPLVTLCGRTAVGRAGTSLLSNLGLPEWIASSEEEFVNLAVDLARDLPRLEQLRLSLRDRMRLSPLMDAPQFAREMESIYGEIWRRWCADAIL